MERNISYIHSNKLAVSGKKYYDKSGNIYIGLTNGRLKLYKAKDTVESTSLPTPQQTTPTSTTGVQSVTGLDTNNTDPQNPVIDIAVDGVTITGDGTPGNPLVAATPSAPDLDAVLTAGNDGGGQDIVNVAGLQDSTSTRSVDIENRQLIKSTGFVWTLDWENEILGDSVGQTSLDWENRFLVDNILGTSIDWQNRILYDSLGIGKFDWENFQFTTLAGGGTQMLTVDNTGTILAAPVPGAGSYSIVNVNFAASPYTVIPTSGWTIYQVDCTGGNVVINFPTAVGNTAIYTVKKVDATLNNITLTPNGVETINGAPTETILFENSSIDVYSNNANLYLK
jgi:hypothetical protein